MHPHHLFTLPPPSTPHTTSSLPPQKKTAGLKKLPTVYGELLKLVPLALGNQMFHSKSHCACVCVRVCLWQWMLSVKKYRITYILHLYQWGVELADILQYKSCTSFTQQKPTFYFVHQNTLSLHIPQNSNPFSVQWHTSWVIPHPPPPPPAHGVTLTTWGALPIQHASVCLVTLLVSLQIHPRQTTTTRRPKHMDIKIWPFPRLRDGMTHN